MTALATFARQVEATEPEPFSWEAHDAEMNRRMAELRAGLERWKATAEAFGRPIRTPNPALFDCEPSERN